jgi:hypothetical protein
MAAHGVLLGGLAMLVGKLLLHMGHTTLLHGRGGDRECKEGFVRGLLRPSAADDSEQPLLDSATIMLSSTSAEA